MRYVLLFVGVMLGCQGDIAIIVMPDRVEPLPDFEAIYHDAEDCVGRTGDFHAVEWYVAEALWHPDNPFLGAYWEASRIYFTRQAWDGLALIPRDDVPWALVRHESIHDILRTGEHVAAFARCDDPVFR